MRRHAHRAAGQLAWTGILRRPRGARYATLQLYRSHHAGGERFAWYARTFREALAQVVDRAPPQAGPVVRIEAVEFDV